jgi:hypothetical protein
MTLAFDKPQNRDIQQVLKWYRFQAELVNQERVFALAALQNSNLQPGAKYFGYTQNEIDHLFDFQRDELDYLAMLNLMASAEAAVRIDYDERVRNKGKNAISLQFRKINKALAKKKANVRLEEDVLDIWSANVHKARKPVSDFKGALGLRHWLAHGRWWENPRMGRRRYTPGDVFDIANKLLRIVGTWPT